MTDAPVKEGVAARLQAVRDQLTLLADYL